MTEPHELTTAKAAQTDPWSSTITAMTAWLATCSCGQWKFTAYDLSTIHDAHGRHTIDQARR